MPQISMHQALIIIITAIMIILILKDWFEDTTSCHVGKYVSIIIVLGSRHFI